MWIQEFVWCHQALSFFLGLVLVPQVTFITRDSSATWWWEWPTAAQRVHLHLADAREEHVSLFARIYVNPEKVSFGPGCVQGYQTDWLTQFSLLSLQKEKVDMWLAAWSESHVMRKELQQERLQGRYKGKKVPSETLKSISMSHCLCNARYTLDTLKYSLPAFTLTPSAEPHLCEPPLFFTSLSL